MNRRNFLGLAAAAEPLRFINKKTGGHPFRVRDAGRRPHMFLGCATHK